ncbi:MAG: sensor histidine kinase [Massilia sp.]
MYTTSSLIVAILWMLLLGWGFFALLRRHLRLDDLLADKEAQMTIERHARSAAERTLAATHQALCQLARQQEGVRESERRRIGRDIHDDLGQNLLALKIDLSLLHVSTTGAHPMITQKVGSMMENLDLTIQSLRAVINDLRPLALEGGLRHAIEWQMAEFSRAHALRHTLMVDPAAIELPADKDRDAMLFRILQEALCNIVRHAHASDVEVELQRDGDRLLLMVRDNGVGMPAELPRHGSGLPGMRERVAAMGGTLVIDCPATGGTNLIVSFPVLQDCALH